MTIKPLPKDHRGPAGWVVCAHCRDMVAYAYTYFNALDADRLTLEDVHVIAPPSKECLERNELICIETRDIPVSDEVEMSPERLYTWGLHLHGIDSHIYDAFYAWAKSNSVVEDDNDLPSIEAFKDAFIGVYASFYEYTSKRIDEDFAKSEVAELVCYFDYEQYAKDQKCYYTVLDLPNGEVAIFN